MNVDLVFEGGGVLGLTFIGAYKALVERGYNIRRCGGTSAGAIMASLIVAGYTPKELEELVSKTEFKDFMKRTEVGKVPLLGKALSLVKDKGIYSSQYIEDWINKQLKKKGIEKFKDVMENGSSKLKIIASDITRRKMLILPDDLIDYGIDPSEFSIGKAVRMSCAIPLYFTPVKLRYNHRFSYIVDGGLLSIYPIWIFDKDAKCPTIGLKIKDTESNSSKGKIGIFSYLRDLLDTTTNRDDSNFIDHKDMVRSIIIDCNNDIKATDFLMDKDTMEFLFDTGYEQTKEVLKDRLFIKKFKLHWSKLCRKNN